MKSKRPSAHPISNLGKFAHPPKTNVNFPEAHKHQTESRSPKLIVKQRKGKRI